MTETESRCAGEAAIQVALNGGFFHLYVTPTDAKRHVGWPILIFDISLNSHPLQILSMHQYLLPLALRSVSIPVRQFPKYFQVLLHTHPSSYTYC